MVILDYAKGPLIMGVVNVTPDSFSDGGEFFEAHHAVDHALKLIDEGADILDIGGESTRPNAKAVSTQEEQSRILPVIAELKKQNITTPISIDTRHADTMQKAIEAGADIINDVSALTHDPKSLGVVAAANVTVILMHMQGTPKTMQARPHYDDVVNDIITYLTARIAICVEAGIEDKNIICDPGIGFGKTLDDNLMILKNLDKFHALNCPILLGASRKSFIEKIIPNTPPQDRLAGSLAAALKGLEKNVQIFRVHDVAQTKQAFNVVQAIDDW